MSITKAINKFGIFCLAITTLAAAGFAQKPGSVVPRQEKLLNGLKVLLWNTPGSDKVAVKLRIHAGAAFDPQEREGVMQLVADSFFPTPETKEFFVDELGGSVSLESNYDYIQISATARPENMLRLLESIATAISANSFDKETTAVVKTALTARVKELEKDPAYVADRAVAKRLFGTFPYGRPEFGSLASVQKIEYADLRIARDRLVTADNATLTIQGAIDPELALRGVRRYFGSWLKADKKAPSTFRQPDPPESAQLEIAMPGISGSEVRYALRGYARSSREFAAAEVLSSVLQARFRDIVAKGLGSDASVSHDEHILPGAFVFRYRSQTRPMPAATNVGAPGTPTSALLTLFAAPVSDAEFSAAKADAAAQMERRDVADWWLDVDTFRITSVADELKSFQNVTAADVNALAQKVAREPIAAVALSKDAATNE